MAELDREGVSFVALGDTMAAPDDRARWPGVRFVSDYKAYEQAHLRRRPFITRGLEGRGKELLAGVGYSLLMGSGYVRGGNGAGPARDAPYLTVARRPARGRVAWLGVDAVPRSYRTNWCAIC